MDDEFDPADAVEEFDEAAGTTVAAAPSGGAAEQMQELVAYLATNLVDDPESVDVEAQQRGQSVHVTLRVQEDELGKVIGRQGRIARAMRTALMIAGSRSNVRATLDIEG